MLKKVDRYKDKAIAFKAGSNLEQCAPMRLAAGIPNPNLMEMCILEEKKDQEI